jgi:hypothetical protein
MRVDELCLGRRGDGTVWRVWFRYVHDEFARAWMIGPHDDFISFDGPLELACFLKDCARTTGQ